MYSYIAKRFKNFELKRIENLDEEIILHIINTSYTAPCTVCGLESKYVHQEFTKTIYDCAYENKTMDWQHFLIQILYRELFILNWS